MLYKSQSDCDTALVLLPNAQPSTSDAVSTESAVNNVTYAYSSEPSSKISYSMATRFNAEQEFSGKLREDLTEKSATTWTRLTTTIFWQRRSSTTGIIYLNGKRKDYIVKRSFPHVQLLQKRLHDEGRVQQPDKTKPCPQESPEANNFDCC
jgi:hypothetical protein